MVGIASDMGQKPSLDECYDARSRESVELGTYPAAEDCILQVTTLVEKLESLGIEVLRPAALEKTNQIFTRDIGFVIEDQFILPNIIEDRKQELGAIEPLLNAIRSSNIIMLPSDCYAEGGDVIIHDPYVFVGVSSDATFEKFQVLGTFQAHKLPLSTFATTVESRPKTHSLLPCREPKWTAISS